MMMTTGKISLHAVRRGMVTLALGAGALALGGCVQMPAGPAPIYSRLPPDQSGVGVHRLTAAERRRYDEIDRQTMAEQDQAMAADAQAQAWSGYYATPVFVSGGWGGRRGWGGWSVGGWGW